MGKFDFIHYLAAKKSVDGRALNRQVLKSLQAHLPGASCQEPLHVLEIAAGIGTMVERMVEWGILENVIYTALDLHPDYIEEAHHRLLRWADGQGFEIQQDASANLIFQRGNHYIEVRLVSADIFEFVKHEESKQRWDLLIAHAFWDLVDPSTLLPDLFALLKPNGLYYFSVNFDGETILLPPINPTLDREIISLYHQTMDEGIDATRPFGHSQTGRQLFAYLHSVGAQILEAGSSDWVVHPQKDGYPTDEAFFLHCIIDTIEASLQEHAPFDMQAWIAERHRQIERNELIYIAHQLDFMGRV